MVACSIVDRIVWLLACLLACLLVLFCVCVCVFACLRVCVFVCAYMFACLLGGVFGCFCLFCCSLAFVDRRTVPDDENALPKEQMRAEQSHLEAPWLVVSWLHDAGFHAPSYLT